jgi:hypothetical protein
MIRTKKLCLISGIIGIVAIVIGLLLYPFDRMTTDDQETALTKLIRVPLQPRRTSGSSTVKLDIPNTQQWKHIRDIWGQPRYVIAVDLGPDSFRQHHVVSLYEAGIKVELFKDGIPIELKPTFAPYGFSDHSQNGCLEFRGNPGDKLTLSVTSKDQPQPKGTELFVISDWINAKDLGVGADISEAIIPYCRWGIGFGCLLLLVSIVLRISVARR